MGYHNDQPNKLPKQGHVTGYSQQASKPDRTDLGREASKVSDYRGVPLTNILLRPLVGKHMDNQKKLFQILL